MYSYKGRVSYSKIDKDGRLSISNVVDAMQDGCMFHNSEAGHSALALLSKNRAWMVSSWHVIFNRRPLLDEFFSVDAWIYQMTGIFASWNYVLKNADGETLAYADAKWFYANPATGKPVRIDEAERNAYTLGEPLEMDYGSRKIACPEHLELKNRIEVSPNYLDTNLHINNGQYIRLAVNALPIDMHVTELRAEYRLAARLGDTLYVHTSSEAKIDSENHADKNLYYVVLTDADKNPYFLCEFTHL